MEPTTSHKTAPDGARERSAVPLGDGNGAQLPSSSPPDPASAEGVVHVVFCADRVFMQHAAVAAVSLLENSPDGRFCIHYVTCDRDPQAEALLAQSIAPYRRATLRFHRVDPDRLAGAFADRHVTRAAYLRFLAPEVLSVDIERIVYLDCDLVVMDDIRHLAAVDLGEHAVGAAPDADWTRGAPDQRLLALGLAPEHVYVLSGMLVMDLRRWRERGLTQRIFDCVDRLGPRLAYHDQDAFNVALKGEIALIDKRWNLQALVYGRWFRRNMPEEHRAIAEARRRPGVIHYSTADKPWRFRSRARRRALYFRYLDLTAWRRARPALSTRAARLEYDVARALIRIGVDVYLASAIFDRLRAHLGRMAGRRVVALTLPE